jgi:hypothetical protein
VGKREARVDDHTALVFGADAMKMFVGTEPSRTSPQKVREFEVLEDNFVAVVLNGRGI